MINKNDILGLLENFSDQLWLPTDIRTIIPEEKFEELSEALESLIKKYER